MARRILTGAIAIAIALAATASAAEKPQRFEVAGDGADSPRATVTLALESDVPDRLRPPIELVLKRGDQTSRWTFAKRRVAPIEIVAPHGEAILTVRASGHEPLIRTVRFDGSARKPLAIRLRSLPVLSGRVVRKDDGLPIAGASIFAGADVVSSTNAAGEWTFDVPPETWPRTLEIRAAGYGAQLVDVPPAKATQELPAIALTVGATIRVALHNADGAPRARTRLALFRPDNATEKTRLRVDTSDENGAVTFRDVGPGDYVIEAIGAEPMQHHAENVERVEVGETRSISIRLDPRRLLLKTRLGETALPNATVRLHHVGGRWDDVLQTDGEGEARAELWQPGEFVAFVESKNLPSPYISVSKIEGADPIERSIVVPARSIAGTIVDAEDGAPIPNANVGLLPLSGGGNLTARSDSAGRFRFSGIGGGRYRVVAAADGYLPHGRGTIVQIQDSDPDHDVTVRLARAASQSVFVVDANGRPLAGATVVDTDRGAITGVRETDAEGRVEIPLAAGQSRLLYVLGPAGSFAIMPLNATATREALRVAMPAAVGSLEIRALDRERHGVAGVTLMLRYNGGLVPLGVLDLIAQIQGNAFQTNAAGVALLRFLPPGLYELWAIGSPQQAREVMRNASTAPIRIALQPGVNRATVTVDAVR